MNRSVVKNPAVILAFAAIYLLWGSTYLAIRIAVEEIPPLLAAGVRFVVAGIVVYLWASAKRDPRPTALQWRNSVVVGFFMFLVAYGSLFWAEESVPSGVASVLVGAIPIWTILLEMLFSKDPLPGWKRFSAMIIGLAGVAVLSFDPSASHTGILPSLAILGSGISWSLGSILSKRIALPESKTIGAGAQMMSGGLLLLLTSLVIHEVPPFPHPSMKAISALAYLIVAGSIVAFTSYVFLLARMPASSVASYAYVNPLVALCLGAWLGKEHLGVRTLLGAFLVLASVLLIFQSGPATQRASDSK